MGPNVYILTRRQSDITDRWQLARAMSCGCGRPVIDANAAVLATREDKLDIQVLTEISTARIKSVRSIILLLYCIIFICDMVSCNTCIIYDMI